LVVGLRWVLLVLAILRLLRRGLLVVLLLGRRLLVIAVGRLGRRLALRIAAVGGLLWVIIALVLRLRRAVAARVVARVSRHVRVGEDRVGAGGEMRLRIEAVEGGYHGAVCRSIVRLRLGFGFGGG
jgi:hypothetical protein